MVAMSKLSALGILAGLKYQNACLLPGSFATTPKLVATNFVGSMGT
jgi:hypothetical protein